MSPTRVVSSRWVLATIAAVGVLGGHAAGQSARPLSGYAIDASNQVGSGGVNSTISPRPINAANLFVTGNVAGGRAFRGFSPIRDSSSLLLPLPTAGLGGFRGDSISVGDVLQGRTNYQTNPFYDTSLTVTSAGGIAQGLNLPGNSALRSPYLVPYGISSTAAGSGRLVDTLSPLSRGTDVGQNDWLTGPSAYALTPQSYAQPVDALAPPSLSQSPLFGATTISTRAPDQPTRIGNPLADFALRGGPGEPKRDEGSAAGQRVLGFLFSNRSALSPADMAPEVFGAKPSGVADVLAPTVGQPPNETVTSTTPLQSDTQGLAIGAAADVNVAGDLVSEFTPERISAYADITQAVEWLRRRAEQDAAATVPPGAVERARNSMERARSLVAEPLDSYAGQIDSRVNQYIIEAEAYTRDGDYYRAAGIYRQASFLDRNNPLIDLGWGHALLFAGDYLGAVYHLTRGIDRFPAIAYFNTDLTSFVSDPTLLDVRRADLEDRLEHRKDYRLRFLLGYAEYYSGLKKFGRPNLERAAAEAPAGSVIARFPDLLVIDENLLHSAATPEDAESR